ncbi:hypothetical protein [Actinocorallia longicatena]|uniref:HTH cro/C1-type domain-containing protein n=1 Tax=Actinocorallia longicatena TaxID=111803 RepID=A0ABP6QFA9_9ACTN
MTTQDTRPEWARRIQAEREARGWNKPALAAELHRVCGISGRSTQSLTRQILGWERGDHYPRDWTAAYAAAFGLDVDDLFPDAPGTVETAVPATPAGEDAEDVKRREAIQNASAIAASAVVSPVLATLTEAWHTSQPRLAGATISQAMLDDWASGYEVHARSYALDTPEIVLANLARDWAEIAPHLAEPQPVKIERDLARAAAKLAYLIAGSALQLGDYRQSSRWWRIARDQADRSGDALLSSWVRSWEVTTRVVEPREDLSELLRLSREALHLAGGNASTTRVYAATVEAEVLAFMGRHDAAVDAMRTAEDAFGQIPADQSQRDELLHFDQSLVYALAGRPDEASVAQSAALRFYTPERHLYTSVQLDLHGAMLNARDDPNEAAKQALRIVDALPPNRRIKRVVLAARRILDVTPPDARTLPAVRELRNLSPV